MRSPGFHLTVGVTGHRTAGVDPEDSPRIESSINDLLLQLTQAAEAVQAQHREVFSADGFCLRLVSALAEGADSVVARLALAAGWRLEACLPFPQDVYEQDFAPGASRAQLAALIARAAAVFALPGRRDATSVAYEAVGRVMLDQSDIVLAVWDGEPARGRGGTAQIAEEAIQRRIPVVHVSTRGVSPPVLLWSELSTLAVEQPTIDTVSRAPMSDVLFPVVAALTMPPDNDVDKRMLARFFSEHTHKRTAALPYPLLLTCAGVRSLRTTDFKPLPPDACAARLREMLQTAPRTGGHGQIVDQQLLARYGVADAAASYFAQVFRSGFVANFGLAALAVTLAAAGLLVDKSFKFSLIVAELAIIFLILINTRGGTQARWHERWMDDRHLAEQLRSLALGSLVGDLDLRGSDARDAAVVPGWVRWLSRATARELGLPTAVVNDDYLRRIRELMLAMIDSQLAYHQQTELQARKLDHRLHRMGAVLFGTTLVGCVLWVAFELLRQWLALDLALNFTPVVTALSAALPAIGAAMYGMRMQGDFAGVADRALVTVKRLTRLRRAIDQERLEFSRAVSLWRRLADIMLTDVANWRTNYQARPLTLPG